MNTHLITGEEMTKNCKHLLIPGLPELTLRLHVLNNMTALLQDYPKLINHLDKKEIEILGIIHEMLDQFVHYLTLQAMETMPPA